MPLHCISFAWVFVFVSLFTRLLFVFAFCSSSALSRFRFTHTHTQTGAERHPFPVNEIKSIKITFFSFLDSHWFYVDFHLFRPVLAKSVHHSASVRPIAKVRQNHRRVPLVSSPGARSTFVRISPDSIIIISCCGCRKSYLAHPISQGNESVFYRTSTRASFWSCFQASTSMASHTIVTMNMNNRASVHLFAPSERHE